MYLWIFIRVHQVLMIIIFILISLYSLNVILESVSHGAAGIMRYFSSGKEVRAHTASNCFARHGDAVMFSLCLQPSV